tara:strand:- start:1006 stop:1242 length:237 start_codon:yes stop_codon:yes gene_type:complete
MEKLLTKKRKKNEIEHLDYNLSQGNIVVDSNMIGNSIGTQRAQRSPSAKYRKSRKELEETNTYRPPTASRTRDPNRPV